MTIFIPWIILSHREKRLLLRSWIRPAEEKALTRLQPLQKLVPRCILQAWWAADGGELLETAQEFGVDCRLVQERDNSNRACDHSGGQKRTEQHRPVWRYEPDVDGGICR